MRLITALSFSSFFCLRQLMVYYGILSVYKDNAWAINRWKLCVDDIV